MARLRSTRSKDSSANLGFEATLWQAADRLRTNMDPAEDKHFVLERFRVDSGWCLA